MGRHTWTRVGRKWRDQQLEELREEVREIQRKIWQAKWDARVPLDEPEGDGAAEEYPHPDA